MTFVDVNFIKARAANGPQATNGSPRNLRKKTARGFIHCAAINKSLVGMVIGSLLLLAATIRPGAAQQTAPPSKVVGRDTCKRCHASEMAAWEHSSHNLKAWSLLDHTKAAGFAKAVGVAEIKGAALCTRCHGTQQEQDDRLVIAKGNSCESCHGGAGGKGGWLAMHHDFGLGRQVTSKTPMAELLADRGKETPQHRAARDAACKKAGMNRSADVLSIARNCLQCHLVPNEKLVAAGHPLSARFELVEWSQGEVRHNFLLNPKENAAVPTNWTDPVRNGPGRTIEGRKRLMVLAGLLADLEVSLRARSQVTSTKRKSLGDELNDRILDIQEELEEIDLAELKPVLAAIENFDKKSLREITSQDKTIYSAAADAVAQAAEALVAAHQTGNTLPEDIKIPRRAKGDPYQG